MKEFIKKENELKEVIEYLKELIGDSSIVLLRGDLASGKTTFVKEYLKSIGIKESVTSPTFSILQNYGDNIFHYDIYNKGITDFLSLGLLENLGLEGIHFIEWADEKFERMIKDYMLGYVVVEIEVVDDKRKYSIKEG